MNYSAHRTNSPNHAVSWPFLPSDFNGKEKDYEPGFHYYGARYYWSEVLTGWLSVDPMMDKYPSISPYAYCAWTRPTGGDEHRLIKSNLVNNPVKLGDPDGRDVWKLNKSGELIWKEESETDVIRAKDGTSVELSTGVLVHRKSYTKDDGPMGLVLDKNTGGDEGQKLFEFLSDHSNVEFSLIGVDGENQNDGTRLTCSILTTSYDSGGDDYGSKVTHSLGKSIISHTHNHPDGYTAPSSSLTNTEFEGLNDRDFYKKIRENNPNCRFFIYGEYQRGGRYRECEGDNEGKFTKSQYNKKLVYGK